MKKLLIFGIAESLIKVIPVATVPLYLLIIGLDGYGYLTLFSVSVSLMIPLISLGYSNIIIRSIHSQGSVIKKFREYVLIVSITSILSIGILLVLNWFFDISFFYYLAVIFTSLLSSVFLATKDILIHSSKRHEYSKGILIHSLSVNIHTLVLLLFLNLEAGDVWIARFYGEVLALISATFFTVKAINFTGKLSLSLSELLNVKFLHNIILSISFIPRTAIIWFRNFVERKYIASEIGAHELGLYSLSYQFSTVLSLPLQILIMYFSPNLVTKAKDKRLKLLKVISFVFGYMLTLSILIYLAIWIIDLFSDYDFNEYYFLILVMTFNSVLFITSNFLMSVKIHGNRSDRKHSELLLLYVLIPLLIYFYEPKELTIVAILMLIISVIYFIYSIWSLKRNA